MLRNILAQQLDQLRQSGYLESVGTDKRFAIAGTGEQEPRKHVWCQERFHFVRRCAGLWGLSMERLLPVTYKSSIKHSVEPCNCR